MRRLSFAALSFCCLMTSVFLLYSMTLLHFAAGSWAFLHVPATDPRTGAFWDDLAILCCQIGGGICFALSWMSRDRVRRVLKWSPLFIAAFAVITWTVSLALAPLHVAR